jgi:hypothetical protein
MYRVMHLVLAQHLSRSWQQQQPSLVLCWVLWLQLLSLAYCTIIPMVPGRVPQPAAKHTQILNAAADEPDREAESQHSVYSQPPLPANQPIAGIHSSHSPQRARAQQQSISAPPTSRQATTSKRSILV